MRKVSFNREKNLIFVLLGENSNGNNTNASYSAIYISLYECNAMIKKGQKVEGDMFVLRFLRIYASFKKTVCRYFEGNTLKFSSVDTIF